MQNSHYLPGLVYQPCFLSAVFYNKSKVTNMKEAQQGNYRAYGAKSGVDGYPWDYDYWSTCGARNIEKKPTKTFPEEVVIEAKFQVLVSCLDGGGQHKWWIRGKTARWSKTYGQKILSTIIWPRKNIVCKHTAKKKYCLQSNGRQKNIASNHLANKKYCLQSYGQQKNIPQKRILSANQSVVYCQY